MTSRHLVYLLLLCTVLGLGCARASRDASGFALHDETVVDAPYDVAWQAAKSALRERELNLYTRDKRGTFVAFSNMKRALGLFTPSRVKYTVQLEPVSNDATRVKIETVNQVYGVTLLTYPDWHDRKAKSNEVALALLDAVQGKVTGVAVAPTEATDDTAPADAPIDADPQEELSPEPPVVQDEDLAPLPSPAPPETPAAPAETEPSPEPVG
jgi:hypothetical protein